MNSNRISNSMNDNNNSRVRQNSSDEWFSHPEASRFSDDDDDGRTQLHRNQDVKRTYRKNSNSPQHDSKNNEGAETAAQDALWSSVLSSISILPSVLLESTSIVSRGSTDDDDKKQQRQIQLQLQQLQLQLQQQQLQQQYQQQLLQQQQEQLKLQHQHLQLQLQTQSQQGIIGNSYKEQELYEKDQGRFEIQQRSAKNYLAVDEGLMVSSHITASTTDSSMPDNVVSLGSSSSNTSPSTSLTNIVAESTMTGKGRDGAAVGKKLEPLYRSHMLFKESRLSSIPESSLPSNDHAKDPLTPYPYVKRISEDDVKIEVNNRVDGTFIAGSGGVITSDNDSLSSHFDNENKDDIDQPEKQETDPLFRETIIKIVVLCVLFAFGTTMGFLFTGMRHNFGGPSNNDTNVTDYNSTNAISSSQFTDANASMVCKDNDLIPFADYKNCTWLQSQAFSVKRFYCTNFSQSNSSLANPGSSIYNGNRDDPNNTTSSNNGNNRYRIRGRRHLLDNNSTTGYDDNHLVLGVSDICQITCNSFQNVPNGSSTYMSDCVLPNGTGN